MADSLEGARLRLAALIADSSIVRVVASGSQRGASPRWRRIEIRPVELKAGRRLQLTAYDATQAHVSNHLVSDGTLPEALMAMIAEPFGNWHVSTATEEHQMRVTKKGGVLWQRTKRADVAAPDLSHDRAKDRVVSADAAFLAELGITDDGGRVKPSRQAKYRQVEEFVRMLATTVEEAIEAGHLRRPVEGQPLRVVDLGCGNAYLTFAADHWFAEVAGLAADFVGVDVKEQSATHNRAVAARIGVEQRVSFVVSPIAEVPIDGQVDIVLALHACDTATDDALAAAVRWRAPVILAAPCCHHDVARQLRAATPPAPYAALVRDGILRERFADTLTDALRASLLREHGYRVDVVDFVDSAHTPRNTLVRAVRTGTASNADAVAQTRALTGQWQIEPRLAVLLAD